MGVTLRMVRTLQMFSVSGSLRAGLRGECCRCLAAARARVEARMEFLLQRKEASEDELAALEDEDDVEIVDPGVREIDLVGRLHDALVLEMPLRIYCKPDCLGLCPRCGEDLNRVTCSCAEQVVDPRWGGPGPAEAAAESKELRREMAAVAETKDLTDPPRQAPHPLEAEGRRRHLLRQLRPARPSPPRLQELRPLPGPRLPRTRGLGPSP